MAGSPNNMVARFPTTNQMARQLFRQAQVLFFLFFIAIVGVVGVVGVVGIVVASDQLRKGLFVLLFFWQKLLFFFFLFN